MLTTNYLQKKFTNVAAGQSIVVPWTAVSAQQVRVVRADGVTPLSASAYSVIELSGGGLQVNFPSALTGTYFIIRATPALQLREIGNQTAFDAEIVEESWDYQMQVTQEQGEKLSRALAVPMGVAVGAVRPGQPGQALMWGPGNTVVPGPDSADLASAAGILEAAEAAAQAAPYSFPNVATLQATQQAFPVGSLLTTRAEGFGYQVFTPTTEDPAHLTTASGMALRVLPRDGAMNVRAFGVKGDGVTNETVLIQAAINAAGAGKLIFPPGDYRLSQVTIQEGLEIAAVNGASELTANAGGTQLTGVRFRYIGAVDATAIMFLFRAATAGQWVKGGGITGRPHISGENAGGVGVQISSGHGVTVDAEVSRFQTAGVVLNASNLAMTQFCRVDVKYSCGASPVAENSHGVVLNGNHPTNPDGFFGCTQNTIRTNGLTTKGDMLRVVGHADNNFLHLHGTDGIAGSDLSGRTLALYLGTGGHAPRNNYVYNFCGDVWLDAASYGTVIVTSTSEGAQIEGGGQYFPISMLDYATGKVYGATPSPIHYERMTGAAALQMDGAATPGSARTVPEIVFPESGEAGAAFAFYEPSWGAGTIASLALIVRSSTAGTALFTVEVTQTRAGEGGAADKTVSHTAAIPAGGAFVKVTVPVNYDFAADSILGFRVARFPANALDTHTGSVSLIGVVPRLNFYGPASLWKSLPPFRYSKDG